jgi:hypothetical protein
MTAEVRNILIGFALTMFVIGWLSRDAWGQEPNSEYLKQILRLQYTEVCSTSLPKGDALPNALNKALEADPKTWLPWVLWWNATREKYEKARCENA